MLLVMTAFLFVSGLTALFLPEGFEMWALSPHAVFVVMIFVNLINIHNLEKRYTSNISKVMEKL